MKRFFCIILAVISLFALASCSREEGEAPVGMKNAASEANDFYLYVPDEWIVNTSDKDLMAAARVSENDSSNVTMIGYSDAEKEYESIESYWEYYSGELANRVFDKVKDEESGEEVTSFKLTNEGEDILVNEKTAKKYEYSGKVAGIDLSYMQVIIKRENVFYIFTYTSTPDLYSKHDTEIELILNFIDFK